MNLKQKLSKKLKKSGGFTLIEMLIVVAIIAILVAVSIPLVGSSLNKAKDATDAANERAAKSAALIAYMTDGVADDYNYDAAAGTLLSRDREPAGYGQCSDHKGEYLIVKINNKGEVTLQWSESKDSSDLHNGIVD